jgi:hypothetical protein
VGGLLTGAKNTVLSFLGEQKKYSLLICVRMISFIPLICPGKYHHAASQYCFIFPGVAIIFQDPDPFPGCIGSGSVSRYNGTTKLTGRENLTKKTFCAGPSGPTDKENQLKMYKKYSFRYITYLKGSGSVSD